MGISNQFHFEWLDQAIAPIRGSVRQSLPKYPQVLGIGEQDPSPFIVKLLEGTDFKYTACDLFPETPEVFACDMNDLSPLFGKLHPDVITLFRASYFIKDKHSFFAQLEKLLNPNGFLFMDLLVGSSDLPVLDFRYGAGRASIAQADPGAVFYQTSFFDERLVREFPGEVNAFCEHARNWPRETKLNYLRHEPRFFLRDESALKHLLPQNLGAQIRAALAEKNVFSLKDFEDAGFEIMAFNARYFYPQVKKFNLYCFVAAHLKARG